MYEHGCIKKKRSLTIEELHKRRMIQMVIVGVILLVLAGLTVFFVANEITSEIEDCGGVASCLGEMAQDFDESRRK